MISTMSLAARMRSSSVGSKKPAMTGGRGGRAGDAYFLAVAVMISSTGSRAFFFSAASAFKNGS